MSKRNFRTRRTSSTSEEDEETEKEVHGNEGSDSAGEMTKLSAKEKIEELKFIQKQRERKNGIDVYSLAIGEQKVKTTKVEVIENDPWKKKTGGLVDMKVLKVQRENEIVTSMASNFAKETNQRDEDAEMQKFIEEQIEKKKLAEKRAKEGDALTSAEADDQDNVKKPNVFKRPEDALFDLPKYLITNTSKHRSEESLSEQMLSGIPEVDLGVSERIRNIEETERAKQKNFKISSEKTKADDMYVPQAHFVQHKRFDDTLINPDHMVKRRMERPNTQTKDIQPVVGDAPKHELLQQSDQTQHSLNNYKSYKSSNNNKPNPNARRQYHVSTNERTQEQESASGASSSIAAEGTTEKDPANQTDTSKRPHKRPSNTSTEKASDDYCLERFKKNMRRNRSSKIKIA